MVPRVREVAAAPAGVTVEGRARWDQTRWSPIKPGQSVVSEPSAVCAGSESNKAVRNVAQTRCTPNEFMTWPTPSL